MGHTVLFSEQHEMKEVISPEASHGQKLSSILLEETRQQVTSTQETAAAPPAQRNAYTKPVSYKIIVLGESGVGKKNLRFCNLSIICTLFCCDVYRYV
jgi:hypothetical protein